MPSPEQSFEPKIEKEEKAFVLEKDKEIDYERVREPWIERYEVSGNTIEVHFTGKEWGANIKEDEHSSKTGANQEVDKIEVVTPEGKRFDFASLLPKEWHFTIKDIVFYVDWMRTYHSDKKVFFSKFLREEKTRPLTEEFTSPQEYENKRGGRKIEGNMIIEWENKARLSYSDSLFVLLHEIGHAWHPEERFLKYEEIEFKIHEKIDTAEKMGESPRFSDEELDKYWQNVMSVERDAWAYALNQYRRLRKEGINILPGLNSNEDVLEIVRRSLFSYLEKFKHLNQLPGFEKEKESLILKTIKRLEKNLE